MDRSKTTPSLLPSAKEMLEFIQLFAATLLVAGSQTSRVDRTVGRIAHAYGFGVELAILSRHFMLTVVRPGENGQPPERRTAVSTLTGAAPNFQRVAALNALSWRIADERPPLAEAERRYRAICAVPPISPRLLRWLVPSASAALCRLFGGDAIAMLVVFCATFAGYYLRQKTAQVRLDTKISFVLCSFAASLLTAPGVLLHWGGTPETATATSVLFLIPGLPLLNAVLDVLDGHVLLGMARLIQAATLIVCIALGLSFTMLLVGMDSL